MKTSTQLADGSAAFWNDWPSVMDDLSVTCIRKAPSDEVLDNLCEAAYASRKGAILSYKEPRYWLIDKPVLWIFDYKSVWIPYAAESLLRPRVDGGL